MHIPTDFPAIAIGADLVTQVTLHKAPNPRPHPQSRYKGAWFLR